MEEVNGLRRRAEEEDAEAMDDDDDEAVTLWFLKSVDRNRDAILASLLNLEAMSIAMIVLFRIRRRLVFFRYGPFSDQASCTTFIYVSFDHDSKEILYYIIFITIIICFIVLSYFCWLNIHI